MEHYVEVILCIHYAIAILDCHYSEGITMPELPGSVRMQSLHGSGPYVHFVVVFPWIPFLVVIVQITACKRLSNFTTRKWTALFGSDPYRSLLDSGCFHLVHKFFIHPTWQRLHGLAGRRSLHFSARQTLLSSEPFFARM